MNTKSQDRVSLLQMHSHPPKDVICAIRQLTIAYATALKIRPQDAWLIQKAILNKNNYLMSTWGNKDKNIQKFCQKLLQAVDIPDKIDTLCKEYITAIRSNQYGNKKHLQMA